MQLSDFFALQLDNQADLDVFLSLEMNLRCLNGKDGLRKALARMEKSFPSRKASYESDWYKSLIGAIKPFYYPDVGGRSGEDDYTHPLNEFLQAQMSKLNGSSLMLLMRMTPNLGNFSEAELSQPHMQWLKAYTGRINQIKADYPECKGLIRLTRVHPIMGLSDDKLIELGQEFEDSGYYCGMNFTDYVNWYVRSCANFEKENESLPADLEAKLLKTLRVWSENSNDKDSHCENLCRNYEFHPQHKGFIAKLVSFNMSNV